MGIKAQPQQPTHANPGSPAPPVASDAQALTMEDALVMVIFPQATWDAVVQLATELHVAPAEALGAAIKLLRARVDEETGHG
jgi:hypothetical protein